MKIFCSGLIPSSFMLWEPRLSQCVGNISYNEQELGSWDWPGILKIFWFMKNVGRDHSASLPTSITYRENSCARPHHSLYLYLTSASLSALAWLSVLNFSWWIDESLLVNHSPLSFFFFSSFLPEMSRETSLSAGTVWSRVLFLLEDGGA